MRGTLEWINTNITFITDNIGLESTRTCSIDSIYLNDLLNTLYCNPSMITCFKLNVATENAIHFLYCFYELLYRADLGW